MDFIYYTIIARKDLGFFNSFEIYVNATKDLSPCALQIFRLVYKSFLLILRNQFMGFSMFYTSNIKQMIHVSTHIYRL